jgi:hypothetical protein
MKVKGILNKPKKKGFEAKEKSSWIESGALKKILFAVFVAAIIFRFFSIIVVPEPAYNDAVYHLELAQSLMNHEQLTKDTPPFLYHLLLAGFFGITGLSMQWPFVKVIPALVMLVQVGMAYLLFKKVFPKNYLIPAIFFTSFPWLIRMGSVNMVESFSVMTVVAFLYFFYNMINEKEKKRELFFALLTVFSFLLMAMSKTNAIFILPVLLLGFGFFALKKFGAKKAVPLFLTALLFSASFIIISSSLPAGNSASSIRELPLPRIDAMSPMFIPKSFAAFFDFPHESSFSKIPLLQMFPYLPVLIVFILLMIPLGLMLLKGIYLPLNEFLKGKEMLKDKNKLFWVFVAIALIVSIYPSLTIIRESEIYARYLLPGVPFAALLLGRAFEESKEKIKKIVLVSLIVLAVFSFASTSLSALYYYDIQQKNTPLYAYLNSVDSFDSVFSKHNSRAIRYYTNKETVEIQEKTITIDEILDEYGWQTKYAALTCYNEDLFTTIKDIDDESKQTIIFQSGCAKVIELHN